LLNHAGVSFSFPPEEVSCCGDPARVLGDERLFQETTEKYLQWLAESGAGAVLVHCPHCYHVLREACRRCGARCDVVHTTTFFRDLMEQGRLVPEPRDGLLPVAYHDPCFLGRYEDICAPPREILFAIAGEGVLEPEHSGKKAFCCGAGGGHFFMDLDEGERPASKRLREMLEGSPRTLAVSCHFCFSMFDDAGKRLEPPARVRIVDHGSLPRSERKSRRVFDRRED